MHKLPFFAAAIAAFAALLISFDARAFPVPPSPGENGLAITLIAGGCGIGFHRGPYGACRPNVGYVAPGYGVYRGGVYGGGVYRGGVYRGGVYRGGVYRGGVYRHGVYRGGAYRHGVYRGRVYRR
ncbi:MAG TPA: hypothetical protein VEK34_16705 [Methylocella sp.]|nr:hypothetical protein [Methylocella sp.]